YMGTLFLLRGFFPAVPDAPARRHSLAIARQDHRSGAQTVLVLEFAFENVCDDLHVAVRMRRKSRRRCNVVFIDHAQGSEAHPARIVVVAKTEGVPGVQPAEIAAAAFVGTP